MNLMDKIKDKVSGGDYDELLEILASDDDGEMSVAEIQDITGWKKDNIVGRLRMLIHIKAVTGRFHAGKQKVFFNSVDTTPYKSQKQIYGAGGVSEVLHRSIRRHWQGRQK